MRPSIEQQHTGEPLSAGQGSGWADQRSLPDTFHKRGGNVSDSPRIIAFIGINGGVEPFEFISFRHEGAISRG